MAEIGRTFDTVTFVVADLAQVVNFPTKNGRLCRLRK